MKALIHRLSRVLITRHCCVDIWIQTNFSLWHFHKMKINSGLGKHPFFQRNFAGGITPKTGRDCSIERRLPPWALKYHLAWLRQERAFLPWRGVKWDRKHWVWGSEMCGWRWQVAGSERWSECFPMSIHSWEGSWRRGCRLAQCEGRWNFKGVVGEES